tara:strand:- start:1136 stop:3835 length:2700 start_codon:yes stop_codon:yes gene_type:complete
MGIIEKIFGSFSQKQLKRIKPIVKAINNLETKISKLSDVDLKEKRNEFINRHANGEALDDLLEESFAVAREVSKRSLKLRPYDCQLMGGIILHNGLIAEMGTGEGKTLAATLPAYLNSFTKRKIVLVTVNDYLAKRDATWMEPIYSNLGMIVSYVISGMNPEERSLAYEADVIYATNNELGFDYLRNNMVFRKDDRVMNDFYFAIVDEVDSVLIDEARTPLVISGASEDSSKVFQRIGKIIPKLKQESAKEDDSEDVSLEIDETLKGHFIVDEKSRQIELTDLGHDFIEGLLQKEGLIEKNQSLYSANNLRLLHYIQSSLRAHFLFKKDIDYLIQDNQIILIDENTGRAMSGRRLADGLHQAIEEKEKVPIQMESQTLASSTFQNYFRQYEKLAGMTGTAFTEAQEFKEIYGLDVIEVPTNERMVRVDHNDMVYLTKEEKYKAIVQEIKEFKDKGNPILAGTASLESSELLSNYLNKENINHQVLNAKNHAREAEIISQAGKPSVITIATNMAGRGTDIVLGGNWEMEYKKQENKSLEAKELMMTEWRALNKRVIESGGLHVIGTERNESRRIDNQLRGRSGRQGDPGSSKFYLSLEDSLMRIFSSKRFINIMQNLGLENGESIEHKMLSGAIQRAQKRVEGRNFDIRKVLLEYDDMAHEQRQIIYSQRDGILEEEDISETISFMRNEVIESLIESYMPKETNITFDIKSLEQTLQNEFGQYFPIQAWLNQNNQIETNEVIDKVTEGINRSYKEKSDSVGESMRDFEKQILLQIIDNNWKEHLGAMEYLRQSIGLRGYASKNPKLEFRRESFELFEDMLSNIRIEAVKFLSRVQIEIKDSSALENMQESRKETYEHAKAQPILSENVEESSSEKNSDKNPIGNRRLRRFEAKMAKKKKN